MVDRLRVLHVNSGNLYGGVETLLATLAQCRTLAPNMLPEFALCYSGRHAEELRAAGCAVHGLGAVRFSQPWTAWRARWRLGRLLRPGRFHAVVAHQPWVQWLAGGTVRRCGAIYAAYFHGVCGEDVISRRSRRVPPHLCIAPSRVIFQSMAHWYPAVPRVVIRNPLPVRFHELGLLDEAHRAEVRAALGAGPQDVVLLMATRVEALKGPDVALAALARLGARAGWQFWYAGGPQRPHERELYERLQAMSRSAGLDDRVRFLGERADLPALMQAADVYVQPNRLPEGFGLTFLEAGSCGKPVVTTFPGAAGEAVDEQTALIVPPDDPAALASTLGRLIEDRGLRERLGAAAREKVRRECDPGTQLRALEAALRDALSRRGAGGGSGGGSGPASPAV